jgi:hypothetical protein
MRQEDVYALMSMEGVNNQAVEQVRAARFPATHPCHLCKRLTDNLPSPQHFQAPPAPLLPALPSLIPPSPTYVWPPSHVTCTYIPTTLVVTLLSGLTTTHRRPLPLRCRRIFLSSASREFSRHNFPPIPPSPKLIPPAPLVLLLSFDPCALLPTIKTKIWL